MDAWFDPALYALRLGRAHDVSLREHLAACARNRLDDMRRCFRHVGVVSDGPSLLQPHPTCGRIQTIDCPLEAPLPCVPGSLDALVCLGRLHHTNDVPGFLMQARRALAPDGLFLALFPGAQTLATLREALMDAELALRGGCAARIHPMIDGRDAAGLLQRAGFILPVVDVETTTVSYADLFCALRDLQAVGETNVLRERTRLPLTRAVLAHAEMLLRQRTADEESRIHVRGDVVVMTGWTPRG